MQMLLKPLPQVGAIEGVYKNVTGEEITLSQQYIVDCTFTYSGCAGGEAKDGRFRQGMRGVKPRII